jgi:hypothetical protein
LSCLVSKVGSFRPGVLRRRTFGPATSPPRSSPSPGVVGSPARRCVPISEHPAGPSGAPRSHAVVLTCRPPSRMKPGFTSPWSRSPPESPRPPAGRPSRAGADSHEVLRPFDGIPRASPVCSGSSTVRCGSALRFSQPLGGFLASPGFAALFHAAAARGVLPSEPCSSPGSRAPLGVALLPCSSPPAAIVRGSSAAFSLRVSPTPAPLDAVAWFPTGARTPFPPRVRVRPHRLPRRPDHTRPPGRERRPASSASKP